MIDPLDIPRYSYARFAAIGGLIGALIATIAGMISKFVDLDPIRYEANKVILHVWPWFYGFAFTGSDYPPLTLDFIGPFAFTIFLNFLIYWILAGIIWCGIHWHKVFFVIAAAPVAYYWFIILN